MTWEDFRDSVEDRTVVIIPMGSVELEGPCLPLGVDTIVAEGVAAELLRLDGLLIGPTIPVGYSRWFVPFPGTISLEQDTLRKVLLEYCECLISHGVRRILFLNSHRGNNPCIDSVAHILTDREGVRIAMINIWKLANDLVKDKGIIDEGRFTHAGEIMTSLILALKPETVKKDRLRDDYLRSPENSAFKVKNSLGETLFKNSVQMIYQDIRKLTDSGIMGDPTKASEDKGKRLLAMITEYVSEFIEEFRKMPLS